MSKDALSIRKRLLEEIEQLARRALYGTLSKSYRTCGNPLPLSPPRPQARAPLIYQLPGAERKDYRLLCAGICPERGASWRRSPEAFAIPLAPALHTQQ